MLGLKVLKSVWWDKWCKNSYGGVKGVKNRYSGIKGVKISRLVLGGRRLPWGCIDSPTL